jgi:chromosome segregation ATPase
MLLAASFSVTATAQTEVRATPSAIPAGDAREHELSRRLIDALESENAALKARLATELETTRVLTELNEARKSETDALRHALAANNETIAAKDSAIAAQGRLIGELKQKRVSIWKRIGDIAIGAAVGAIIR